MNERIKDTISQPAESVLHPADMAYVVEQYIYELKGENVKIAIVGADHPLYRQLPEPMFAQMVVIPESNKLATAYEKARGYFMEKL